MAISHSNASARRGRIVSAFVAFALLTSLAPPARAAKPEPVDVARLEQQLREAHYARIGVAGRTFVLVKPRVGPDGLAYEHVEGFPRTRPAIVTGADWDSIAPPTSPVPWSTLERIESGNRSNHAATGAVVGLVGGLAVGGYVAAFAEMGGGNTGWQAMLATAALTTVIGAGIGALIRTTDWVQVHPKTVESER